MPKVTVIIPTYNREAFIGAAVESVLQQRCADLEIIVIDDGSTDHTRSILRPYGGRLVYRYQKNAGVSAARNAGIAIAKGEWIAFLDSDDEWLPEYLERQCDGIRRYPAARMHMTNSLTVLPDGRKVNTFDHNALISEFGGQDHLLWETPLYQIVKYRLTSLQATIMHRPTVMEAGLFDTTLHIAEDYDLICRMALKGALGISREALACMHRRQESIQNLTAQLSNKGIYSFESFAKVQNNLLKSDKVLPREKALLKKKLSSNKRALGNLHLRLGKGRDARRFFREAVALYPSLNSVLKYLISFLPAEAAYTFVQKGRDINP